MTTQKGSDELQLRDEWMEKAKEIKNLKQFEAFYKELCAHKHDYGTIVHAVAALGVAGCWLMEHSEQGGITGFQARCALWDLIRGWMPEYKDAHLKLVNYDDLLYPQSLDRFKHVIPKKFAKEIKENAAKLVRERKKGKDCHEEVFSHWERLASGWLPSFITISDRA